jgi:hypothetical protein
MVFCALGLTPNDPDELPRRETPDGRLADALSKTQMLAAVSSIR